MQEVFEKTTDKLEHEKIKTNYAEIIIKHPLEKPYYAIVYFDLTDGELHEGFGSYCLEYVVEWKRDCFEIVDQVAEEINQSLANNNQSLANNNQSLANDGWIPCSEQEEPNEYGKYIVYVQHYSNKDLFNTCVVEWFGEWKVNYDWNIIAWQPLPKPYKKEV